MAESKLSEEDVKQHLDEINKKYKFDYPQIKEEQVEIVKLQLSTRKILSVSCLQDMERRFVSLHLF